jgi:hypothetical protein
MSKQKHNFQIVRQTCAEVIEDTVNEFMQRSFHDTSHQLTKELFYAAVVSACVENANAAVAEYVKAVGSFDEQSQRIDAAYKLIIASLYEVVTTLEKQGNGITQNAVSRLQDKLETASEAPAVEGWKLLDEAGVSHDVTLPTNADAETSTADDTPTP